MSVTSLTGPLPLTRLYPQTSPQLAAAVVLVQLLATALPPRTSIHLNHRGALTVYVDDLRDARQLAERWGLTPVYEGPYPRDWEGTLPLGVPGAVRSLSPEPEPVDAVTLPIGVPA